jgi:hypothetical protein
MNIVLGHQALAKFALFEEKDLGVIALGLRYGEDAPLHVVILQIAEHPGAPASDTQPGMYVEIDGHGFEDGVLALHYDEPAGHMRVVLMPGKHPPLTGLQLTIPQPLCPEQLQLLQRLVSAHARSQSVS